MQVTRETIQIVTSCYPETMGHCVIYLPPFVFSAFFDSVKRFIDPKSASKIIVISGDVGPGSANDQLLTDLIGHDWRVGRWAASSLVRPACLSLPACLPPGCSSSPACLPAWCTVHADADGRGPGGGAVGLLPGLRPLQVLARTGGRGPRSTGTDATHPALSKVGRERSRQALMTGRQRREGQLW